MPTQSAASNKNGKKKPTFERIHELVTEGSPGEARQNGEAWPLIYFLYEKLESGNSKERQRAAHYLCYLPPIGDEDSIEKLKNALNKEDDLEVIKSIIWAFRGLEAREVLPQLQTMYNDKKYSPIKATIQKGMDYLMGK